MLIRSLPVSILLTILSAVFFCQPVLAKKMYRWVDENGKIYLSDQVPPEHAQYKRESLNNKGRVLAVTEQAKSREQRALDERLESLKKAQEKIIAKQRAQDKVLLSTFRSVDDMKSALNNKMLSLDSQTKVLQNNVKQSEVQLESLLKKAAGHERNGEKIPPLLLGEIKSAKMQIETIKTEIGKQLEKKNVAKADFEADIERYKLLTQANTEEVHKLSDQSAEMMAADALGLFPCRDDLECAKAWEIAHKFVKEHSTTATDIDNDTLMMTKEPATDSDLSLSISKLGLENTKQQIFLDIRCRQSSLGKELCAGQKATSIRSAFRSYVESGLTEGR
jgi:hypothetical protein